MTAFLSFFVFVSVYLGSGIYFTFQGVTPAFSQIPIGVALLAGLTVGIFFGKGALSEKVESLTDGMCDPTIITMIMIFIISGAFSKVTISMGCIDSCIQLLHSIVPSYALLPGMFLFSSLISLAIGTSMGTLATVAPLAVGLAHQTNLDLPLLLATVIGGSIFGDNLSLISDTTVAACKSMTADFKKKFNFNAKIAFTASIFTVLYLLLFSSNNIQSIPFNESYSFVKIFPYPFIIALALTGLDVFIVLILGLIVSGFVGISFGDYTFLHYVKDIQRGFYECFDIVLLSIFIGGMNGLFKAQGGIEFFTKKTEKCCTNRLVAKFMICIITTLCVCFVGNNTMAILIASPFAKNIANKYRFLPHKTATWVDIFACSIKGILPYGGQILLASSFANISPFLISSHVYYCYILLIVSFFWIIAEYFREEIVLS